MIFCSSTRHTTFSILLIVVICTGLFISCQKELHEPKESVPESSPVDDNHPDSTSEEFIIYTINNQTYSIKTPEDSVINYFLPRTSTPAMQIFAIDRNSTSSDSLNIYFSQPGIARNSTQELFGFYSVHFDGLNVNIPNGTAIRVHITEFGSIGQFMAGNFSGNLIGPSPAQKLYQVICSFRVRRNG